MITRIERRETGWFVVTDAADTGLTAGATVWVSSRGEKVKYRRGHTTWTAEPAFFEAHFEPADDEARQREINAIMRDIETMHAEASTSVQALGAGTVHLDDGGKVAGALVKAGSAHQAKIALAKVRNQAQRLKLRMEGRQKELKSLLEEQSSLMMEKLQDLQGFVKKAEKAIWTINLYLGTDEEVVQLQDGAPAPADEPIAIRQQVLYMDEECAIAAEQGGIDARDIDKFDDWLLDDPSHLDQVLPERKGLVALRPRKKDSERTGDPWTDAALAEANKKTYFLIRNGERLYRFWTSYEAGARLMPRQDEFIQYFQERVYEGFSSSRMEPIKPGSEKWMKAQEQADAAQFPFRVFFLMLQGLMDRTTLFHPLPGPVRLDNPNTWGTVFRIVKDDEMALSDGVERFRDWQARINKGLDVGHRIVGAFSGLRHYDRDGRWSRESNSRLSPRNAPYPPSNEVLAIEARKGGGFAVPFARTDTNWRSTNHYDWKTKSWGDGKYKTRATVVVFPADTFIIDFDADDCTVDRMRYYLRSRLDREEYASMIPVLKATIAAKEAEEQAEAPLRQLLAGRIAQVHGVPVPEAEEAVPELVRWWKIKNRHHRALSKDDAKAVRMIVDEFGRRRMVDTADDACTATLVRANPDALLIAKRPDGHYVVLTPENDERVFVRETVHSVTMRTVDDRRWRTVDARWQSWRVLRSSPLWETWERNANPADRLTDEERVRLATELWLKKATPEALLVGTTATHDDQGRDTVHLYWRPKPPDVQNERHGMTIQRTVAEWKRDRHRAVVLTGSHTHTVNWRQYDYFDKVQRGIPFEGKVLWREQANIDQVDREHQELREAQKRHSAVEARFTALQFALEGALKKRIEADAYVRFLEEHGDPDLWDGHKKTLKLKQVEYHGARRLFEHLLRHEVDPRGMTLKAAVAAYRALPPDPYVKGHHYDYRSYDVGPPEDLLDVVVPHVVFDEEKPPATQEESDDEPEIEVEEDDDTGDFDDDDVEYNDE